MAGKDKQELTGEALVAENLRLQNEILSVQLQTGKLQLEQQRDSNEEYVARKEKRARDNAQRQNQLKVEVQVANIVISGCAHRQGGKPDDIYAGNGPSSLTRSETFFEGNEIIQCSRCRLKMARPLTSLKKTNRRKYEADVELYNRLRKESISNGLTPMKSPTFSFTDSDGMAIMPAIR